MKNKVTFHVKQLELFNSSEYINEETINVIIWALIEYEYVKNNGIVPEEKNSKIQQYIRNKIK